MAIAEAEPDKLIGFETTTRDGLAELYDPALDLIGKLHAVRSNADAQPYVTYVPYIGQEVLDLYSIGRELASWVGDVGRDFRRADGNGDGKVDESLLTVERIGDGEMTVLEVNGRIVVSTGSGDDDVRVVNSGDGIKIIVNGNEHTVDGMSASNVIIRTGGGNDTIEVDTDVEVHLTLEGQDDDDTIEAGAGNETILGGEGRDYIDGFSGDDVIDGGDGHDVIYAGDGKDEVVGGAGRDYMEGGRDDDVIVGGIHNDVISGGEGADRIDGEEGNDVIYTGHDDDRVTDHSGDNTVYGQFDDDIDTNTGNSSSTVVYVDLSGQPGETAIRVDGDDRFEQRVYQDLEMLRSSPNGRAMLLAFDDIHEDTKAIAADWPILGGPAYDGDVITIRQQANPADGNEAGWDGTLLGRENHIDYVPTGITNEDNFSSDDQVSYGERPPVVGLFHEMAHQYDYGYDTSVDGDYQEPGGDTVPNDERQAVGLPIDYDDDSSTPEGIDPDHPEEYTENGLREEMGLPDRPSYGDPPPNYQPPPP